MSPELKTDFPQAVATLQDHVYDLIDLGLLTKQAHWNVTGANFRPIHLQLDEIVDLARTYSDEIAERINALKAFPQGQVRHVAEASKFESWPAGALNDDDVVDGMVSRLDALTSRMRERIEALDPEPGSQDLLIAQLQELEKQAWMLRAQKS